MITIIPAILATTEEDFERDISKLNDSHSFNEGWVHFDFMDNLFVQNKSIDPNLVSKYPTPLTKEAHLMVQKPNDWIEALIKNDFQRIIIHLESDNVLEAIDKAKENNKEVGIAVKIDTDLSKLEPFLDIIDLVMIMSVEPGFQGQPFLPGAIERVRKLVKMRAEKGLSFLISVDGHVSDVNTKPIIEEGVDILVVGSFLLKAKNIDENLEKIWEAVKG